MTVRKIKEKQLIFGEDGELKGSLDTIEVPEIRGARMLKLNFEDEEGRDLVIEEMEKIIEESRKWLASLTFPEKMKAYGHTFESLAEAYRMEVNRTCEYARRLRLIQKWIDARKGPSYCTCSAMVWDQDFEGYVVPYLYCVIKEGLERIKADGGECSICESAPCDHFWDPEHNSMDCKDFVRRRSKKYPINPCVYASPSDEDIDMALSLHSEDLEEVEK